MPDALQTFGSFPLDPSRDRRDAEIILDIMASTRNWTASAPHAASAFNVMRRYAMAVWEKGRLPGERIWRLGSSGLPWSPKAHAMIDTAHQAGRAHRFTFEDDSQPRARLTLEHVVPSAVVQRRLDDARTVEDVVAVLRDTYRVAVVTRQEATVVLPKNDMPAEWDGADPWARYREAHRSGRIDFEVEDMLIGPTFKEMRPLRDVILGHHSTGKS